MSTAELIPAPPAGFIFTTTAEDLRRNTGALPEWANRIHAGDDVTANPMDLDATGSWIRVIRRRDQTVILTATAPRSNTRKVYRSFTWDNVTDDERLWAVWMVRGAGYEVESCDTRDHVEDPTSMDAPAMFFTHQKLGPRR